MKKLYSFLMFMGVLALLYPSQAFGQTYTYDEAKSALNAGNPGGKRSSGYDYTTTGATKIHQGNWGSGGTSTSSSNYWSPAVKLPISFKFYGVDRDSFCISKNGLLTFSTSVAGTAVNSSLNSNSALPNSNLPDSSIAYLWDDYGAYGSAYDYVYMFTVGSTGSRQVWIQHYSWAHITSSYNYHYWALVLEEGTNNVYVVDQNYYYLPSSYSHSSTVGVQLDASNSSQITSGLHSSAGSPNLVWGAYAGSSFADNEYYTLTPRLLVTDNMSVNSITNPTGAVCSTSDSVKVNVSNDGTNTVTAFDVKWWVNGVSQSTYSYSGSLGADSAITLNLGQHTYSSALKQTIKVKVEKPNGNSDNDGAKDSLSELFGKGLSGSYTIGGSGANYASIAAAVAALDTYGVCGPVVFKIADGTYTGQHEIDKMISGASSTNTITFTSASADASKVTLKYNRSSSSADMHVIQLKNTRHIILRDLTIDGSVSAAYTYIWPVHIYNSNDITITNCVINSDYTYSSSYGYDYCVMVNNSATSTSTGYDASNIVVDSCTITAKKGYAFYCRGGGTTSLTSGIEFTNNTIKTGYYGSYIYYSDAPVASGNTITQIGSLSYTTMMYFGYCDNALRCEGNVGTGFIDGTGFYFYACDGTSSDRGLVANNMIQIGDGSNSVQGIALSSCSQLRVYHNSVNVTSSYSSSSYAPLYCYITSSTSNCEVKNNIFMNSGGGYAAYYRSADYLSDVDNNVYYTSGNSIIYNSYSTYTSLSSYVSALSSGREGNSVFEMAPFKSSTDLHLSDPCFNKFASVSAVTTDIDGDTRPSQTQAGADHAGQNTDDVGVLAILDPNGTVTAGSQSVRVVVQNYGSNAVTGYSLNYLTSTGNTGSDMVNATLTSCSLDTVTFPIGFNHTSGCATIRAWTSAPSNNTDNNKLNDTSAVTSFGTAMSGSFTIGGSGADFNTFADALDALNCAGVTGAVTFNVRSGTYPEKVELSSVSGMSSTNTVTFQSDASNATKPILAYKGTSSNDEWTLNFKNASNFIIDGLQIKGTSTNQYARVVVFNETNSNITIKNCTIEAPEANSTSSYLTCIYDNSGTTNMANNIKIQDCELTNGTYGIYSYGGSSSTRQSGWEITNCVIKNFTFYGVIGVYMSGMKVKGNVITTNSTYVSSQYGIYMYYSDDAMQVTGNTITGLNGGNGIYYYYCDASSSSRGLTANNMVQVGNGSNFAAGIYAAYSRYQDFYHNTVNVTSTSTSTNAVPFYNFHTSSTYYNRAVNNIFVNSGGGNVVYMYRGSYFQELDYNVYYSTNSNPYYDYYSNRTFSSYKSNTGKEGNSWEQNPPFASTSDLHLTDPCFDKVPYQSMITTDIDGATRGTSTTYPGADELPTGAVDIGVTKVLSPAGVVGSGSQSVSVQVRNFGTSAITSVTVDYDAGNSNTGQETFSGISIASCAYDTLTFSSGFSQTVGCSEIQAWTSAPNNGTDAVPSNDTSGATGFGVALAGGTYTIGGTSGDFNTFNDAIDRLNCAGIAGPIVFNVASGTYNERILMPNITGASSTNTITFRSAPGNASKPMIMYTNTNDYNNNYVWRFDGTNNVTIDGIELMSMNTSGYSHVIEFINSNEAITIQNCRLENYDSTTTSNYTALIYDWSGSTNMTNNVTIKNNTFQYGGYAIYAYGNGSSQLQSGWVIEGNTMNKFSYYGVYLYFMKDLKLRDNDMYVRDYYTSPYSCRFYYCDGALEITGNKMVMPYGGYGMYMYYCDASPSGYSLIANNYIETGTQSSSYWGRPVYAYYGSYSRWYNNTFVNNYASTSSSYAACRIYYTQNNSYVRNNIFAANGGGYTVYFYNPSYLRSDNNNFYTSGSSTLIYAQGTYTSLGAYQSARTRDLNSLELDPNFSTSVPYRPNEGRFYGAGDSTGLATDIDGNARMTFPSIGALELNPDLNIMSVSVADTVCGTSNPAASVTVTFKNESDVDLQVAELGVQVDAGAVQKEMMSGPFMKGMTYTRTLTTTVDLSGTTDNVVTVTSEGGDVDATDNSASTTVPYWAIPVSSFTQADSCLNDAMQFTSTSTVANGTITSTAWNYGDGNTGTGSTSSNTYASSGSYNVSISSTSSNGCTDTVTQSINVLTELNPGTITGDSTICYNSASGSILNTNLASGSAGTYAYQWQMSTDNTNWSDVSGATSEDYNPSGNLTTTTYYRRGATTSVGCGPEYTASVKITVYDMLVGGTIGMDSTICYNTAPATIAQTAPPTGGNGTWTYQWEKSTDNATWSKINGATSTSYSPAKLTKTTYYRLVYTAGLGCGKVNSNVATISVYSDLHPGIVGNNHSVCPQSPANELKSTTAADGGDMTYTYQWQTSANNATWTDISGATGEKLNSTVGLTSTTYYRRITTSGSGCGTKATNSVRVRIAPLPVSNFILANHCFNDVMPVTNNSTVVSGSLTGFDWDFGDSSTSTAQVPAHVYATSGIKTVKLKVTTNIGCVDSSTKTVNVSNIPTPAMTNVYDCVTGDMRFKNATSVNCGKISAFFWDFGDGNTSTTPNPSHKYAATGTYNVKFKIFLPGGFKDSITRPVTIYDETVAGFTADDECFGDSVRFVNASTNATTYEWQFGDRNTSSTENPVHFYRVAGTYNVMLVTTDGNMCNDTTTKKVTVKVKPSVYFTKDDLCVNAATPFNNGTLYAHTYAWNFGDGNSSNTSAKSFGHTYTSDGQYTVKLVAYNNNGCRDSFSTNVISYPNPTASFTINDACSGSTVSLTNTSASNHSNRWDMGDGTSYTVASPSHSYAAAGTYNVKLAIESIHGCKADATGSVTIYDTPKAAFTSTKACEGDATVFTNTTSGGSGTMSYSWDFGDGNSSSAANPTHTYASSGKYNATLTATGMGNCNASVTNVVEVNTLPTVSVSVADVCVGTVSSFIATTSGASTYLWNFGDGNSSTAQSPSHTYASAGSYTVTLVAKAANGCETTATTTATVNDMPVAGFTATTECYGTATSFTNTSTGGGTMTYAWSFGDGNASTATNPSHMYASAGNYTVDLTTTANGCSNTTSMNVTVNAVPTAEFSTADNCLGDASTFVNTSGGATSYSWNFGDGNSSTASNPSHTYGAAGQYTVTLTASNGSCSSTASETFMVNALPTVDFSAADECEDVSVSFTNNSASGSYYWSFGDGQVSTTTSPSHTYAKGGTYNVQLEVTDVNGCENTGTLALVIHAAPVAMFDQATGCADAAIQFSNTSTGAVSYEWNFGDGNTSTSMSPSHTYNTAGTYTVTLSATNAENCTSMYTASVVVAANPIVSFTANTACEGGLTQFDNTSDQGANAWAFDDGTTSRLQDPGHYYASAGTYNVKLTVTNGKGCSASTVSAVTVNPNPVASFTAQAECTGTDVTLTNNSSIASGSIASSAWNYGDGMTGTSGTHSYANSGVYNVTLTVTSNTGCVSSTSMPVAVYNAPNASFSAADVCLGTDASFRNMSSSATSYSWNFGDGGSSSFTNPTHSYSSAGTYTVTLTATNGIGCDDVTTQSITINDSPTADFAATDACEDASIMFNNTSSGGATYAWTFGDGGMSMDEHPSHTFTSSGAKTVTLMAYSSNGCSDEISRTVTVHRSPVAGFTFKGICEGDATQFYNNSSQATSYAWSFGDGNSSTGSSATNTYGSAGDYRALLIASNANCKDSFETTVSINPLPNSGFTFTTSGREVSFSPVTLGGSTYSWNFGDGAASTDVSPMHKYVGAVTETYNVCLELTDKFGCMTETCNDVNVDLVGVSNIDPASAFNVYPNPNQGKFTITLTDAHGDLDIDVYDAHGRLIKQIDTSKASTSYVVDVTGIAEGVYFVTLKNGAYTATQRVVITR